MIPQSFIQDLLNRVDIVGVVERYLPLKRAGANYVACCPFHNEKSPSFTVSPTKQFYHCFGCGAHGTAIGFVIEHTGMGFVEAVKDLAGSVGMQVPDVRPEIAQAGAARAAVQDDLHDVMLKAMQYYRQQLKTTPRAVEYLKQRGLSGEIARDFGIGYAPAAWQNLREAFGDYDAATLVSAGLVIEGDGDKRYDRFRDRIMFPIIDTRGRVVGFGGRVIDQGEPKYLNSPETPLFEKGRELYGLFQGRRAIRDAGRAVVVEGYMDVVALAQAEVRYAVATLGTATTPAHVQKLLRQIDEIVFCFDGDAAGRKAAWRALENSLDVLADGKELRFLFLPDGEDPDTYVRSQGRPAFEALLADALPLSRFLLQELADAVDLASAEGRARLLQNARPLIKRVQAPLLSLMLRQELARLGGIAQAELDAQYQIQAVNAPRGRGPAPRQARDRGQVSTEKSLLQCVFDNPARAAEVPRECLESTGRESEFLKDMLDFLASVPQEGTSQAVIQHYTGGPYDAELQEVLRGLSEWGDGYDYPAQFADGVATIRRNHDKRALNALLEKNQRGAWSEADKARYTVLQQALSGARPAAQGGENSDTGAAG